MHRNIRVSFFIQLHAARDVVNSRVNRQRAFSQALPVVTTSIIIIMSFI